MHDFSNEYSSLFLEKIYIYLDIYKQFIAFTDTYKLSFDLNILKFLLQHNNILSSLVFAIRKLFLSFVVISLILGFEVYKSYLKSVCVSC